MIVFNVLFALYASMNGDVKLSPFEQETWFNGRVAVHYWQDNQMFEEVCSDEKTFPKFAQTLDCSDMAN